MRARVLLYTVLSILLTVKTLDSELLFTWCRIIRKIILHWTIISPVLKKAWEPWREQITYISESSGCPFHDTVSKVCWSRFHSPYIY
jgi:hypothetical protein